MKCLFKNKLLAACQKNISNQLYDGKIIVKMKISNPFTLDIRLVTRKMYIVSEETGLSRDFHFFLAYVVVCTFFSNMLF